MLHRTKKENDLNHDKWLGVGGKFEEGESPEDCMLREVWEETGFTITKWRYCGIVTFVHNIYDDEHMHIFVCNDWTGNQIECKYWLPTNILTSCRNEIMANIEQWRKIVENRNFVKLFGRPEDVRQGDSEMWPVSPKGFGITHLKSAPAGFPRDYEFIQYLRMKDYCCWRIVPDTFFEGDGWLDEAARIFKAAKPMMDFVNNVIDDYE